MADAAKTYDPETNQAVERAAAGERVVVRCHGADLVAVVPLADLRRLERLEAEHTAREHSENGAGEPSASRSAEHESGLDLFISMAGEVRSGSHDVSSDKYRHLADAYASKP